MISIKKWHINMFKLFYFTLFITMKKSLSFLAMLMLWVMWTWTWLWVYAQENLWETVDWIDVTAFAEEGDSWENVVSTSNVDLWEDEELNIDESFNWLEETDDETENFENNLPIENESYATPEDVKSVDTWIELNIAISLFVLAVASAVWYRKLQSR